MERPMNNAKSARKQTLPELLGDNKSSLLLPQVQANNQFNNRSTPDKPMTVLVLCSDAMMIHLAPTDYVQETSLGTLNVTASKSTTPHKPT
jgi:hypothetical protein